MLFKVPFLAENDLLTGSTASIQDGSGTSDDYDGVPTIDGDEAWDEYDDAYAPSHRDMQ
jgi:hypothetical protein